MVAMGMVRRVTRLGRSLHWIAALALGVVIGALAAGYVIGRPDGSAPDEIGARLTYRVEEGTLGRSLFVPAVAEWPVAGVFHTPAGGIVTEIVTTSGLVRPGDVVLRLNERPMVILPGPIPAFRALAVGLRGRDVAALQAYLESLGHQIASDEMVFTETTANAVRAWQGELGLPKTGTVDLGDVMFVDPKAFDGPMRWTAVVTVGARIAAGTPLIERLADVPTLTVQFGGSPPAQLEEGLRAQASFPNGQRQVVELSVFRTLEGLQIADLAPPVGRLCRIAECLSLVAPFGQTSVEVEFTLVPETTGSLIPTAAVQSDGAGRSFVELRDGSRRPVVVIVADGGMAIVDGVSVGEGVVLP